MLRCLKLLSARDDRRRRVHASDHFQGFLVERPFSRIKYTFANRPPPAYTFRNIPSLWQDARYVFKQIRHEISMQLKKLSLIFLAENARV